jgi:hypothetical protein
MAHTLAFPHNLLHRLQDRLSRKGDVFTPTCEPPLTYDPLLIHEERSGAFSRSRKPGGQHRAHEKHDEGNRPLPPASTRTNPCLDCVPDPSMLPYIEHLGLSASRSCQILAWVG